MSTSKTVPYLEATFAVVVWGASFIAIGSHYQVADGVFADLMKELGIPRPADVPREATTDWRRSGVIKTDWFRPFKEKGRSTLSKYECPHCGLKIRVGINDDPRLVHDVYSQEKGEKYFW